jgi:hypothetical protein
MSQNKRTTRYFIATLHWQNAKFFDGHWQNSNLSKSLPGYHLGNG